MYQRTLPEEEEAKVVEFVTKYANSNVNYVIVVENEGKIEHHPRLNQPCYGEMRVYPPKGETGYEPKPHDLHDPFPDGKPIGLGVSWFNMNEAVVDWLFSDDSPFTSLIKEGGVVRIKSQDKTTGFVLTNAQVDADYLVFFMIFSRYLWYGRGIKGLFPSLIARGVRPSVAALIDFHTTNGKDFSNWGHYNAFDYILTVKFSFSKFINGTPTIRNILWGDRGIYRRRDLANIWKGKDSIYDDIDYAKKYTYTPDEIVKDILPLVERRLV